MRYARLLRNITLVLLVLYAYPLSAQSPSLKIRYNISEGMDTNVFEQSRDMQFDLLTRLGIHARLKHKPASNRWLFNLSVQSAYDHYIANDVERRWLTDGGAVIEAKFMRNIRYGAEAQWRGKFFLFDDKDYTTSQGQIYLSYRFLKKNQIKISFRKSKLNYDVLENYNYNSEGVSARITRQISRKTTWNVRAAFDQLNYERLIYLLSDEFMNNNSPQQRDRLTEISLGFQTYNGFLTGLQYEFQRNRSNSNAYNFYRHRLVFMFSKKISANIFFQLYSAFQLKLYEKAIQNILPLGVDTEQLQDNILLTEFTKTLSSTQSLFFRFGWYKNESFQRSRFYRKTVFTLGLEIHQ